MQAAKADFSRIEYLLDSWHQRTANTVIQLNQFKPEFGFDFAQHRIAGSVACRVPTSGERNHRPNELYGVCKTLPYNQQTGSISGAGAGEIGWSQTCRPARVKTAAAAIP